MTIKELSDRIKECINIRSQMNDLGLSELFSMKEYYNIMNNYIRTGQKSNGIIDINEINRELHYTFNDNSGECTVVLKVKNK